MVDLKEKIKLNELIRLLIMDLEEMVVVFCIEVELWFLVCSLDMEVLVLLVCFLVFLSLCCILWYLVRLMVVIFFYKY